jgi:hypothetical protein
MLGKSLLKSLNGAASFDGNSEIGPGVLEDAVEARGGKDEIGTRGRIAPGELCAATTRDDGEARFVGETEGGGELLFGGGLKDEVRLKARDGVGGRGGANVVRAQGHAVVVFECG